MELAQIRKDLAAATARLSELSAAEEAVKRLAQQEASRVQQLTADLTKVRRTLTLLPRLVQACNAWLSERGWSWC